jgi:hypothetical protein
MPFSNARALSIQLKELRDGLLHCSDIIYITKRAGANCFPVYISTYLKRARKKFLHCLHGQTNFF